jgi:hypothetical protein
MKYRSLVFVFLALVLMCGSASATTNDYIFYLSCNEGSGSTAYDATGNHNATLGAGVSWVDGVSGGGLLIDRDADSLLTIADDDELDMFNSEFGIAFYIRPYEDYDTDINLKTFMMKRSATYSTDGWEVGSYHYGTKPMRFTLSNATGEQDMDSDSLAGSWANDTGYWLFYNFNGTHTTYYKDNVLVGTTEFTRTGDYPKNNTAALSLFNNYYGIVDEIYLFNHTLSESDRDSIYIEQDTYVATDGSDDTGDGSISNPYQTIDYALTTISGGKTLWIRGGTYYNQSIDTIEGLSDDHTLISGYPGERVIMQGNGSVNLRGVIANNDDYCDIKNITINGYYYGITGAYSTGNNYENVTVLNCTEGILLTDGTTYNIFENVTVRDITEHGFQIKNIVPSAITSHNKILNSTLINCGHNTIDIYGNVSSCTIDGNYLAFEDGYFDSDVAIYFHNGINQYHVVTNNYISGISRAIEFYDADSIIIDNNTICNYTSSSNNPNAFRFGGVNYLGRQVGNITITNNEFIDLYNVYKFDDADNDNNMYNNVTMRDNTHNNVTTNFQFYHNGTFADIVIQDEIFDSFTFTWSNTVSGEVIKYVNSNDAAIYSDGSNTYTDEGDYTQLWIKSDVSILWLQSAILSISSFTPTDTTPESTNGTEQIFLLDLNKNATSTAIYIDSELVGWDNSTSTPCYSNSTATVGEYNVTMVATDGVTEVSQMWTWTVEEGSETPVNPTFVAVGGGFAAVIFTIGSWINQRRKRW